MATDGCLIVENEGFKISIKGGRDTRTRFTIGHEIGHTYFYDLGQGPPRRLLQSTFSKDEETFCNIVAAELLMPSQMLIKEIGFIGFTVGINPLVIIRRLAEKFKVSPEAMARRIIEDLRIIHGILLNARWQKKQDDTEKDEDEDFDWRLCWWAASPGITESLYLPSVKTKPKLKLDILEMAFINDALDHFEVGLQKIKLGNLKKVMATFITDKQNIEIWINAIRPAGIQIGSLLPENSEQESNVPSLKFPSGTEDIHRGLGALKTRTEMLIFIPFNEQRQIHQGQLF